MALIEDYGETTLILHPLAVDSSTKKDDQEIRWDTIYRLQMNAIHKEDVSSPNRRHVPQDKGWPIGDLSTDDHGSLLFGCFLFSPSLGGHG